MRRASIAEWIFSLVMSADQAASTTGDLLELPGSFWWGVARIFAASVWRIFAAHPFRIARAAAVSFLLQVLIPILPAFLYFRLDIFTHPDIWHACVLCSMLLTQFLIGRFILGKPGANAIVVCIAVGFLNCLVGALNVNMGSVNMVIWQIPLMAGFVMARRLKVRCAI